MPARVFADTSALVPLFHERDPLHPRILEEYSVLKREGKRLLTTTDIVDELVTLLRTRVSFKHALAAGSALRGSGSLFPVHAVNDRIRDDAWDIFRKYQDQCFSLTDCTSFVTMKMFRIVEALTFDGHFRIMGFTTRPK